MNNPYNLPEKLQNLDWYAIACKVRAKYEKLREDHTNLESSLVGYQREIEEQEKVIGEQNEQLLAHQEAIEKLYDRVEADGNKIQDQKLLIEELTRQWKDSEVQRGKLERECSLLQENYNQLQYQIKEKEKENKELMVRLQRQQRSTLEYKAALDQYLDASSGEKPKVLNTEKTTIKSWSESGEPKKISDQLTINQLSNFAIAPTPSFVNIPLTNNDQKTNEQKEEKKPDLEVEIPDKKEINSVQEEAIINPPSPETIQQPAKKSINLKHINLLSEIKPSNQDNQSNQGDKKVILDLPDFFKHKRDDS